MGYRGLRVTGFRDRLTRTNPWRLIGWVIVGWLVLLGILTILSVTASVSYGSALSTQARHERYACRHIPLCWQNYTADLLGVNARVLQYEVALGIAHAKHQPVQSCGCMAGRILQLDQKVMLYSRRKFRQWWAEPGTKAGRRLKGCLIGAAIALGGHVVQLIANPSSWNDWGVLSDTAYLCGVGAITRGH